VVFPATKALLAQPTKVKQPPNWPPAASKPAALPEADLNSRQDWTSHGSSEIDLLVPRREDEKTGKKLLSLRPPVCNDRLSMLHHARSAVFLIESDGDCEHQNSS
jgi:hypothetical protein